MKNTPKVDPILEFIPISLSFILGLCLSLVFYVLNTLTIGFILGFPKHNVGINLATSWLAYPYIGMIVCELWLVFAFFNIKTKFISNAVIYRIILATVSAFSFWQWFSNISWFKYN